MSKESTSAALANIAVILVEPQGGLNIGSVCRAMMNFGFSDLRLVNPQTDHLGEDARLMAVKAGHLLTSAKVFATLAEALADCSLVLGTTRRFGKYREDFLHPDAAARLVLPRAAEARVGLLFGREDVGLHTAELDLCQRFITIPTGDALPSLNLAQAVSICLYETAKAAGEAQGKRPSRRKLATTEAVEGMFGHMRRTLGEIGYLNPQNPEHILRSFRRLFGRGGLNDREVQMLHGLWRRLDWIEGERRKGGSQP